jgi:hypothetical protein
MIAACALTACTATGETRRPFEESLRMNGVRFDVSSANDSSLPTLHLTVSGSRGQTSASRQVDGVVVGAAVADLDGSSAPEVYVFVQSAGSGSYGSLVGYAMEPRSSLETITMPSIADDPRAAQGYQGHDEFRVVRNTLERQFPLYRPGDTNATPTGGRRTVYYGLTRSDAGPTLRVARIVDEAR